MDEAAINKTLWELNEAITSVPLSAGQRTAGGIYVSEAQASHSSTEETLDHLRIQIKYLMFDLEATRRENRYLRQLLENRPRPGKEEPGDLDL
jgi:hypothetical protein